MQARAYQMELLGRAKRGNTIILLPTNSGKTFIACMLIKEMTPSLRARGKKVVFLAPKKELVFQQYKYLQAHTAMGGESGRSVTGDDAIACWSEREWAAVWGGHELLVMTPQLLLDGLKKKFLEYSDVGLLVFDECHHCVKSDPYAQLQANFYHAAPPDARPHILGLTASAVDGLRSSSDGVMRSLERALDSQIVTVQDWVELERIAPRPPPEELEYRVASLDPGDAPGVGPLLRAFLVAFGELGAHAACTAVALELDRRREDALRRWETVDRDVLRCAPPTLYGGTGAADRGEAADRRALLAVARRLAPRLPPGARAVLEATDGGDGADELASLFRRAAKAADAQELARSVAGADGWVSHKVAVLLRRLRALADDGTASRPGWRALVFVERRSTAFALAGVLRASGVGPFRAEAFTGYTVGDLAHRARNREVMSLFRSGHINLLFATEVASEGIDVPECSLVIIFDLKRNVREFIQARGRARHASSQLCVLVAADGGDAAVLATLRSQEEEMRRLARARALAVEEEEKEEEEEDPPGEMEERYTSEVTGAFVLLSDAVSRVAQYASNLPHDQYAEEMWAPRYVTREACGGQFECELTLPQSDDVHRARGRTKRGARARAALAAVAALHAAGRLGDRLQPLRGEEASGDVKRHMYEGEVAHGQARAPSGGLRGRAPFAGMRRLGDCAAGAHRAAGAARARARRRRVRRVAPAPAALPERRVAAGARAIRPTDAARAALVARAAPAVPRPRRRARGRARRVRRRGAD